MKSMNHKVYFMKAAAIPSFHSYTEKETERDDRKEPLKEFFSSPDVERLRNERRKGPDKAVLSAFLGTGPGGTIGGTMVERRLRKGGGTTGEATRGGAVSVEISMVGSFQRTPHSQQPRQGALATASGVRGMPQPDRRLRTALKRKICSAKT